MFLTPKPSNNPTRFRFHTRDHRTPIPHAVPYTEEVPYTVNVPYTEMVEQSYTVMFLTPKPLSRATPFRFHTPNSALALVKFAHSRACNHLQTCTKDDMGSYQTEQVEVPAALELRWWW